MAFDPHGNGIFTHVAVAPSPATSGTTLTVTAGYGATIAALLALAGTTGQVNAVVYPDGSTPGLGNTPEILRVTGVAGDVITIARAQEGWSLQAPSARSIVVTDILSFSITAKHFQDLERVARIVGLTALLSASIQNDTLLGALDPHDTTGGTDGTNVKVRVDALASFLRQGLLGKPGGLVIDGDSRTQTGPGGATTAQGGLSANFTHIFAAMLGVSPDEIRHRGSSGARACVAYRSVPLYSGSGAVSGHSFPPHMQRFGQASKASDKATPGLHLVCFSLNEFGHNTVNINQTTFAQVQRASIHGTRFMVSRVRAARFFASDDASVAYGAGWAAGADGVKLDFSSGKKYKKYTTVGGVSTITVTLPTVIDAPYVKAFGFIANPDGYSTIAAASSGAVSPTTLTVASTTTFPGAPGGSIDIPLAGGGVQAATYSSKTATVFTLDAAGITAMSGKTVAATGADVVRTKGATLNISGTATNATGSVLLGGQGPGASSGGYPDVCHVCKRIVVTPADAGKTIIFTTSGILLGEEIDFDSHWSEDTDPPPCLIFNVPAFAYGAGGYIDAGTDNVNTSTGAQTNITTANASLASLAAEFDAQVAVVDVQTVFNSLYAATLSGAAGTSTTFKIIPRDATNCVINVGSCLRLGNASQNANFCEECVVTACDKTNGGLNDGKWALTLTRGTSPEGGSTTVATNWSSGSAVFDTRAWCADRVHPSHEGMVVFAATALTALGGMAPTTRQIAVSAGYKGQKLPRLGDGCWIGPFDPNGAARTNAAIPALNTIYAFRIIVQEHCEVISLSMTVGNANVATSLIQMGLFQDGPGVFGQPLIDSGDISSALASGTVITYTLPNPFPLEPGTYWLGFCAHTAAGNFKSVKNVLNQFPIATAAQPTSTYVEFHALAYAPAGNGAGSALVAAPNQNLGGATGVIATTALPYISALIAVCPRD